MLTWWGIMLDVADFHRVPVFSGRNLTPYISSFAHSSLSLFERKRQLCNEKSTLF